MADPENTMNLLDWLAAFGALVLGMFGWHYKGQNTRIRELEKAMPTKVDYTTYNDTLSALRNDFKEHANNVERKISEHGTSFEKKLSEHAQSSERQAKSVHSRIDDLYKLEINKKSSGGD